MRNNTYHPVRQTSREWRELRRGLITASLAASCCGAGWDSPQAAYRQITSPDDTHISTWLMEHGREFESVAVALYETVTGNICRECGFWVSSERPWLGASPDRTVGGQEGLAEIKCSRTDHPEPSLCWLIQATVQLYCTDRAWCDIVWWRDGEISVWRVNRSLVSVIVPMLDAYYSDYVKPLTQPRRGQVKKWRPTPLQLTESYVRSV